MQTLTVDQITSDAQQFVASMAERKISSGTQKQYTAEYQRIFGCTAVKEDVLTALRTARSKATYYKRRAAVLYGIAQVMDGDLRKLESADSRQSDASIQALASVIAMLKLIDEITATDECPVKNPQRYSKRKDLRGLPVDWREVIACRLKKGKSKYYLAFLTAAVTGCRPAELQTGVRVRVQDGLLLIAIDGAKVDAKKGQPQRGELCSKVVAEGC